MAELIRVVVVDDHPLILDGIQSQLSSIDHIEVAGQSSGGEGALQLIAELTPDLILMDVTLPGMSGIEATRGFEHCVGYA